jgi:predicted transcriptional regulator
MMVEENRNTHTRERTMTKAQIIETLKDVPDDAVVYVIDTATRGDSVEAVAPVESAVYEEVSMNGQCNLGVYLDARIVDPWDH